jgi:hypothetical protein
MCPSVFPSLAIPTALVALVLIYQLMQFWIAVFIWNAARDSLLNPLQNLFRFILANSWSTIYPQYDVVVWCSPGLILQK